MSGASQDLSRAGLGPEGGATLDFADRTLSGGELELHLGTDGVGVGGGALEVDLEAGLGLLVPKEDCVGPVLRYEQVDTSVVVEIGGGGGALFAVDTDAGGLAGNGGEFALSVADEKQASSGVESWVT